MVVTQRLEKKGSQFETAELHGNCTMGNYVLVK